MNTLRHIWVNRIKGVSILMVVFYHSVITFYPYLGSTEVEYFNRISNFWLNFNVIVAPFRMPVFFFISGFLVYRYVNNVSLKECFDKRVGSVLWVLCIWLIIQFVTIRYANHVFGDPLVHRPNSNIVYSDGIKTLATNLISASTSLWYLYALIINFVTFNLFKRYNKILIIGCLLLNLYSYFNFLGIGWGMNSVFRNAIYYGVGCVYGPILVEEIRRFNVSKYKFHLLALFLFSVLISYFRIKIVISIFSIFVIIKFFMSIDNMQNRVLNGLEIVGAHTLSVYVVHRVLLEFIGLFCIVNLNVLPPPLVHLIYLLYPIVSTFICVHISLWVENFSKTYLKNILFEKPHFQKLNIKNKDIYE